MEFTWDKNKNLENKRKHGLSFEDAAAIFAGPTVTILDDTFDYDEDRFITFSLLGDVVVLVLHVERNLKTRIISMRKAVKTEREYYERKILF